MELFADVANALCQLLLHEHVDILGFHIDRERTVRDILQNSQKLVAEDVRLLTLDDTLLREHLSMGDRAGDVLLIHSRIEADGAVELVGKLAGVSGGTTRPHFRHINLPLI